MELNCPIPITQYKQVLLAHGGGGKLSEQLISKLFLPQFNNPLLNQEHDGAIIDFNGTRLAFSTDSYVVQPLFFPGGDIGELAVNGTVNDLACCGARALYLSLGFIIEEGFSMDELWQITQSIKRAADHAGVQIVTGDTKVVDKGKGDKIFINTSGIGLIDNQIDISSSKLKPGDDIIINGNIADHGITIMLQRAEMQFDNEIKSDTAPLNEMVQNVLGISKNIHMMRDPTRGGLASSLNEIAKKTNLGIEIFENKIPIAENVKNACELLGLDPLHIANEGKILFFVDTDDTQKVLAKMKNQKYGEKACVIGKVVEKDPGYVRLKTSIGSTRIVDMISGEQLPRIC